MQTYLNLDGGSSVSAYDVGEDRIVVYFRDSDAFVFTARDAGAGLVEALKRLAAAGRGLHGLIKFNATAAYVSRALRSRA